MAKIKCRQCKTFFDKPNLEKQIKVFGCNFCTKVCMREFIKEKKVKIKEKIETKKVKTKEKKNGSVSFLTKKADKLWSEAVKIEYNYSCQYCGKTEFLNSHHLFTRSRKSTRWAIDNGICLCSGCHTLSSTFSAHQTSLEFFLWLEGLRGRDWIDKLKDESNKIVKVTPGLISFQIKLLQDYILKNQNDL